MPNMVIATYYNALRGFRHVILPAACGLILAASMPRPGWWIAAWVGLVPLMIALRVANVRRAALQGLIAGIIYYAIILRWVALFGTLPWLLLTIYQSLYLAVFGVLYVRVAPQRIGKLGYLAVPAAWTALQFLRSLSPYAFIWGNLAHSQANCLPIAQISSITGAWGIDFLICFVSLAISAAIDNKPRSVKPLYAAAALVGGVLIFGMVSLRGFEPDYHGRKIAIVQGNMKNDFNPIPNFIPMAIEKYSRLTQIAAKSRPSVILWPESAIPTDISDGYIINTIADIAVASNTCLLVGGYEVPDPIDSSCIYNALLAFDASGELTGSYRKVHLVPYGEFVPLRNKLRFLERYGIRDEDLCPAKEHVLIDTPIGKIGASICFESTFSHISRNETYRGAEVLCVVSNDAWFQRTSAAEQHLMMARLRAIENRRFLLRAAGTGISAVIDPTGRIRHQIGLFEEGIITCEVTQSHDLSIYTLFGDWLPYASIVVALIGLVSAPVKLRRSARDKNNRKHGA